MTAGKLEVSGDGNYCCQGNSPPLSSYGPRMGHPLASGSLAVELGLGKPRCVEGQHSSGPGELPRHSMQALLRTRYYGYQLEFFVAHGRTSRYTRRPFSRRGLPVPRGAPLKRGVVSQGEPISGSVIVWGPAPPEPFGGFGKARRAHLHTCTPCTSQCYYSDSFDSLYALRSSWERPEEQERTRGMSRRHVQSVTHDPVPHKC